MECFISPLRNSTSINRKVTKSKGTVKINAMMSLQNLIPKHKDDFEPLDALENCTPSELKSIAGELLDRIQDGNWPIAGRVALILSKIVNEISFELLTILKGNDSTWKYYCIYGVILRANEQLDNQKLIKELTRIANHPNSSEKAEEVDEAARKVFQKWTHLYH